MEAIGIDAGRGRPGERPWLPAGAFTLAAATIAFGFASRAEGARLGTTLAPFAWEWRPAAALTAIPAAVVVAGALAVAPRLRAPALRPWAFALATLALGLALRVALGTVRRGPDELWSVFAIGRPEAANEYLPALPALDFGARTFLDTFAEVGTSLPVHAVGHPPGLLLLLHWLAIDGAGAMAALTIGVGALTIPLAYLLARCLLDEAGARTATLLYLFAPAAVLYGATSADALFAALATAAAIPLALAATRRRPGRGALALGAAALAVASFFSYAALAIGAWAAVLAQRRAGLWPAARVALACAAALALFYAGLHLATGYDPIGALRATEAVYREGIASRRPYAFWVFGSPVAFLVASGLPIAWLWLRSAGSGGAPAVALLAVVGVAALAGFTKAETERIYQFLIPMACVAAASCLPQRRLPLVLSALAAQALATELLFYTVW